MGVNPADMRRALNAKPRMTFDFMQLDALTAEEASFLPFQPRVHCMSTCPCDEHTSSFEFMFNPTRYTYQCQKHGNPENVDPKTPFLPSQ